MNATHYAASLEAVAQQLGDPSEQVYLALFERAPELEAHFVLDVDGAVRGEMFARVLESLDALVDGAGYAEQWIGAEYSNHVGMGIPEGGFQLFLEVMQDTFRTRLGEHWQPEWEQVWTELVARIAAIEAGSV